MNNKGKPNSVRRSMARGASARGTSGINENGADAYKKSRQSNKGHYRVEFSQMYENMTERDIELRHTYGRDLVALNVGVPADMITLRKKKQGGEQTLTSRDEVFYVKVGKDNYGKLSIRTQRLWKTTALMFVFQVKKSAVKPPVKAYSRSKGFKKQTTSQRSQNNRQSYRKRRGGTY
jgi:hypothetical protein